MTAPPTARRPSGCVWPVPEWPLPQCPQLDNAGGRMKWVPSADAGPWPTDGKVALPSLGVEAPIVRVGVDYQRSDGRAEERTRCRVARPG